MPRARVYVPPKKSIFDPQRKTIPQALRSLRYGSVTAVLLGQIFTIPPAGGARARRAKRLRHPARGGLVSGGDEAEPEGEVPVEAAPKPRRARRPHGARRGARGDRPHHARRPRGGQLLPARAGGGPPRGRG